jgi:hypothetical protein
MTEKNVLKFWRLYALIQTKMQSVHSFPEDSLLMLDLILKYASEIISLEKENILTTNPAVTSERSLSLQMGNKITSAKWRISVLHRLLVFLQCINNQNKLEFLAQFCNQKGSLINGIVEKK